MPRSKSDVRELVRQTRSSRTPAERQSFQKGFTEQLLKLLLTKGARQIAAFLPMASEPPIREFLELVHYQGVEILVPRAHADGTMTWVLFHPDHDQTTSVLGVPEISEGSGRPSAEALASVDLILLPAAAVDAEGTRLGWGKGFYDRALGSSSVLAPTYAVVFDDEVMQALPSEPHDQPVEGAVTPTRVLAFG